MIKNIVYFNNQLEAASERGLACIHMKRGLTPLWKPQCNISLNYVVGAANLDDFIQSLKLHGCQIQLKTKVVSTQPGRVRKKNQLRHFSKACLV